MGNRNLKGHINHKIYKFMNYIKSHVLNSNQWANII